MNTTTLLDRIGTRFTAVVIGAMQILLMIVIGVATLELFWLMFTGASDWLRNVDSVPDLQILIVAMIAVAPTSSSSTSCTPTASYSSASVPR